MGLLIIFATLIVFSRYTRCNSTIVKFKEGQEAHLIFTHPCNSTRVTLRHGYKAPFYDSANPEPNLLLPNKRVIHENQNKTGSETCSIKLIINPVSRDDAGTYILTVYKNGQMLPDYPRIWLRVDYPPGKASCESSNDYNDGEWVSIHCTAKCGSIAGHIVCYQNDMRLPSLTKPVEDRENLSQIILVRLADPVFCCACISGKYKSSSECADFAWDPIQNIALSNFPVPGHASLFMKDLKLSTDATITKPALSSNTQNVTRRNITTIQIHSHHQMKWQYILIGILSTVILILTAMYSYQTIKGKQETFKSIEMGYYQVSSITCKKGEVPVL